MVTSEKPTPMRSRPMPTVQRRSKPVNGRVFELSVVGALLAFAGATAFSGVVASFDGEVPLVAGGVVVAGVVVAGVVVAGVVVAGVVGGGGV
jgi:hypothetical protein